MAIAKWSMGLFLLRIIVKKYQRIAIWSMMISLLLSSFLISTLFWTQRLPPSSIFDQRIPGRRIFDIEIFVKFFGGEQSSRRVPSDGSHKWWKRNVD